MANKITGNRGEEIASGYLKKIGYTIIDRNVHFSRVCELDIVAVDKNKTLVAVEVKTRTTEKLGSPLEAITPQKYKNIRTGLYNYLNEHSEYKKFRIDVVAIVLEPEIKIKHLKNI